MKCIYETQPHGLRNLPYGLLKASGEVVYATIFHCERVLFNGVYYHGVTVTFREIEGEQTRTTLRVKSCGGEYSRHKAIQQADERYQTATRGSVAGYLAEDVYREKLRSSV